MSQITEEIHRVIEFLFKRLKLLLVLSFIAGFLTAIGLTLLFLI